MTARFFTIALFFVANFATAQNTIFVAPGIGGNGKSWKTATNDLQFALKTAKAGTQIWVAEGIYTPTEGADRNTSFEVKDGVQVFGGFAGTEASLTDRQVEMHPTVMSGNIGKQDNDDNSFNVVTMKNVSEKTILDGFIITNGYANGDGQVGDQYRSGGGLFVDASQSANPTVKNCVFIDNFAKDGGAVYVLARNGGRAAVNFRNCHFDTNQSDFDGGAVNLDGRAKGQNNSTFTACSFDNNKGNYGGAVFCYALNGESTPVFTNCRMAANSAYVKGGAIFQLTTDLVGHLETKKVVFSNNQALDHDTDDFTQYSVSTGEFAAK
jgi:hypothetical protein